MAPTKCILAPESLTDTGITLDSPAIMKLYRSADDIVQHTIGFDCLWQDFETGTYDSSSYKSFTVFGIVCQLQVGEAPVCQWSIFRTCPKNYLAVGVLRGHIHG